MKCISPTKLLLIITLCIFSGCNAESPRKNIAELQDFEKDWIVINYWADWCAPCIKEIPELNEFADDNKDIFVFTFNFDQLDQEDLEPIARKFNIQVPSLITHPRDIWGIQTPPAVPATFFINPNGELVLSLFRPQTKDALNNILLDLQQTL